MKRYAPEEGRSELHAGGDACPDSSEPTLLVPTEVPHDQEQQEDVDLPEPERRTYRFHEQKDRGGQRTDGVRLHVEPIAEILPAQHDHREKRYNIESRPHDNRLLKRKHGPHREQDSCKRCVREHHSLQDRTVVQRKSLHDETPTVAVNVEIEEVVEDSPVVCIHRNAVQDHQDRRDCEYGQNDEAQDTDAETPLRNLGRHDRYRYNRFRILRFGVQARIIRSVDRARHYNLRDSHPMSGIDAPNGTRRDRKVPTGTPLRELRSRRDAIRWLRAEHT